MPRSTYFYHKQRVKHPPKDLSLQKLIKEIFDKHKCRYGYRRVTLELKKQGKCVNAKRVRRVMSELNLKALKTKSKYKSYKGSIGKIADNLLKREFKANKPNQKWVTDITEFKVGDEKLYLSPIIDLFNNEIKSYKILKSPKFILVKEMIEEALCSLEESSIKPIIHSDQGWHYQMEYYQKIIKDNKALQSMSRKGNCLDNAAMESFFGVLKNECFYNKRYSSLDELEKELNEYMYYYNNERISVKRGGMSPIEYRICYNKNLDKK